MFSRLNVRTKLLVMVLPVTMVLIVVAGFGIQARLVDRAEAKQQREALVVSAQTADLVHELQRERLLAASAGLGDEATVTATAAALTEQREATDRTAKQLVDTLESGASAGLSGEDLQRSIDVLRSVPTATAEVRSATERQTPVAVADQYGRLIDRAQRAVGTIEVSNSAGSTSSAALSRRWLAQGIEAESKLSAVAMSWYADPAEEGYQAMAALTQDLGGEATLLFDTFTQYADPATADMLSAVRASDASRASDPGIAMLSAPPATRAEAVAMPATAAEWATLAAARTDELLTIESHLLDLDYARTAQHVDSADFAVTWFAAAATAATLGVALLAFAISRGINQSLTRLTDAAHTLSSDQVPTLLESLKTPNFDGTSVAMLEVDTGSNDEFAEVGRSLAELSNAIVHVASEQNQQLRRGISQIFVNLARRNQSLLDRQIQFIDRLETNEEDPDQLENLFRLDHLATRMRRNAESLLVLAGAEAPRRRARNVEIGDVVRVAIGEVEDFARVELVAVEPSIALGSVAVDIAHLLAELMENGAQYSPPNTTVDVVGRRERNGGYSIVITDHGVGMNESQLASANSVLKQPPPVGLALSRSLGFVVAGTLAQRHCIGVELAVGLDGGVVASVSIPAALLADQPTAVDGPREATNAPALGNVVPIRPGSLNTGAAPIPPGKGVPGPLATPPAFTGADAFDAFIAPAEAEASRVELFDRDALFNRADTFEEEAFEDVDVLEEARSFEDARSSEAAGSLESAEPREPERLLSDAPAPHRLVDILPSGDRFDEGVYGLLGSPVLPSIPAPIAHPGRTLAEGAGTKADHVEPTASRPGPPSSGPAAPTPPVWPAGGGPAWVPPAYDPAGTPPGAAFLPPSVPGAVSGVGAQAPIASAPPLPQRRPGASTPTSSIGGDNNIAAPTRPASEGGSALSRYRNGLVTGRSNPHDGAAPQHQGDHQ